MRIRTIVLGLLLCGAAPLWGRPAATDTRPTLAILDLKAGEGVSRSMAAIASELLRTAMVKTQLFTVVDRSAIETILKEQALQRTGLCTDSACAVRIGRLLAAQKMLIGSINRAGDRFILVGNIVDVEKARIDFAEYGTIAGAGRLEQGTEEFGRRIAARIAGVEEDSLAGRKPRWPFVWRSALVPGWGQWHEQRIGGAWAFSVLAAASLANYGSARQEAERARQEYRDTLGFPQALLGGNTMILNYVLFANKRAKFARAERRVLAAGRLFGLVWSLNLFDCFLSPGAVMGFFVAGRDPPVDGLRPEGRVAIGLQFPLTGVWQ